MEKSLEAIGQEKPDMLEEYTSIPFPFKEISTPRFEMGVNWSPDDLLSYMQTWSAVKRFQIEKKYDPISLVRPPLK